jgi:hypothetical protein
LLFGESAATIQVSDHPVEPSSGKVVSTGTFSLCRTLALTCQVVPITVSPVSKDWMCFR